MQVPPTVLRKKIRFWQSHGLLVEKSTNVFLLVEEQDDTQMSHAEIMVEDYESESAMASVQDQREEELQVRVIKTVFFYFIISIFRHFGHTLLAC